MTASVSTTIGPENIIYFALSPELLAQVQGWGGKFKIISKGVVNGEGMLVSEGDINSISSCVIIVKGAGTGHSLRLIQY